MSEIRTPVGRGRWLQLAFGVVCMCMIANMQYGWTFFVNPMQERHGWDRAAIQVAFTLFVVTETWLVPIEGWFVDKYGPRIVTLFGGLLCAIAWVINSYADSLTVLYIAAAIGGTGAGAVYGTCVGNALKWFPDRRGLAAGITAMGFGAGSALTVVPIQAMIKSQGYEAAFLYFGIGQGVIVMLIALFLRSPDQGSGSGGRPGQPVEARLQARRDGAHADLLGDVRDVRDDGGRRPDGHRAARADRQGLQDRRRAGLAPRASRCRRSPSRRPSTGSSTA